MTLRTLCAAAALLAACTAPPGDDALAAPAAEPAQVPAVKPAPEGPANFTFSGELTQGGWILGRAPAGTVSASLGDQALELDDEGNFFAAFDRDAGPSATLSATMADGRVIESLVTVSPREWQIERVNVAKQPGGGPSEAFMRRRKPELEQIWNARAQETGAQGWREHFIWPVTGRISGRFGSQRIYRGEPGSYHTGIDISTGTSGTPFVAPADGVVVLAAEEPFSLEGHLIMIDHGDGLNSAFLHCSEIDVKVGQAVKQGQMLGRIGSSGRATGPHLHWSVKWRDARLDPLLLTGPMP